MKRLCLLTVIFVVLTGCQSEDAQLLSGIRLREKMIAQRCTFVAEIIADYGDRTYTFSMGCSTDPQGNVSFIVISPESISGIAGRLSATSGFLTFDDTALAFPLLADGEVSPVSAPWLLINTLRAGYLTAAGEDGDAVRLTLNDSYEEDPLQIDVWLDENELPQRAEILWQGRRVLSIHIKDFAFV